ncbi:SCO family protein [Aquabacterium sp. A7-Y]|uniref:SCO family protein n=1 Tax=Aquabacterium sp. A7-Y TaxID=1349605 RepID=UPI00223DECCB|nr:SCO family protein [Aquabacterium sp. A7-Y]MCW7539111.1 SCO family protein [Aquabacterium sp. A7-Y]
MKTEAGREAGRRRCLAWLTGLLALTRAASAHEDMGPVEPARPAPDLPLRLDDGGVTRLPALLAGQTTALQFMFTGCSSICPVQGVLFGEAQALLLQAARRQAGPGVQLLSLSIDPLGDDPPRLAAWRRQHGATARWRAAVPPALSAGRVLRSFDAGQRDDDQHTTQVYLFDRLARLVWRTGELPTGAEIAAIALRIDARG